MEESVKSRVNHTIEWVGKRFWWIIGGAALGVGACAVCTSFLLLGAPYDDPSSVGELSWSYLIFGIAWAWLGALVVAMMADDSTDVRELQEVNE